MYSWAPSMTKYCAWPTAEAAVQTGIASVLQRTISRSTEREREREREYSPEREREREREADCKMVLTTRAAVMLYTMCLTHVMCSVVM